MVLPYVPFQLGQTLDSGAAQWPVHGGRAQVVVFGFVVLHALAAPDVRHMSDGLVVRVVFLYCLSVDAREALHFVLVQRGAEGSCEAGHGSFRYKPFE